MRNEKCYQPQKRSVIEVTSYFKWQAPDLKVQFLQKVYVENVLDYIRCVGCPHGQGPLVGHHEPDEPVLTATVPKHGPRGDVSCRPVSASSTQ